jgi:site-specific DNA-methyltransferase (adenine-specific)
MTHPITFGQATLYHGDCLDILPALANPIDALITDPPYSSGGMVRGDRTNQSTAAKYVQSGTALDAEHNAEFLGDNRDARSWGYWMTLWLTAAQPRLKPGAYVMCFTDWRQLPTRLQHQPPLFGRFDDSRLVKSMG